MKGLYIHLPFCRNKCSYCGFYSETDSLDMQEKYFQALLSDLRSRETSEYKTLYIGGGTPSVTDPALLADFLKEISGTTDKTEESTIEANPESVTEDFLSVVRDFGFSRISLGCQSTSDDVLKKLTRIHGRSEIFSSVELIRKRCPDTALNLDMIYDIPGVPFETTVDTLRDIISLSPEHVSAYTYSFDTDFMEDSRSDETDFMLVREYLSDAGYEKYEISNFARPAKESMHNLNYWRLGDYDGLGASAWSLENMNDKRVLRGKTDSIGNYINSPETYAETDETPYPGAVLENLVFGLRITKGVNFEGICEKADAEVREKLYNALIKLTNEGFISWNGSMVSLSPAGELLLDSVQEYLWRQLP